MLVDGLSLPDKLEQLISSGVWPQNENQELDQHGNPIVAKQSLSSFISSERTIYLYRPPFMTLKERIEAGDEVESFKFEDGSNIDPELLVVLGDFGTGSDTYFGIYYKSKTDSNPVVVKEAWDETQSPTAYIGWVRVSDSFFEFSKSLGL